MPGEDKPSIKFTASVRQVKTLVDGGLVFVFDAPESEIAQAAQLMATKNAGIVLNVTCVAQKVAKSEPKPEGGLNIQRKHELTKNPIYNKPSTPKRKRT